MADDDGAEFTEPLDFGGGERPSARGGEDFFFEVGHAGFEFARSSRRAVAFRFQRWIGSVSGWLTAAARLSETAHEKQDDDDDQDDAEGTDPTVTVAVTVAAEAATEATEQENYEDDNENGSE